VKKHSWFDGRREYKVDGERAYERQRKHGRVPWRAFGRLRRDGTQRKTEVCDPWWMRVLTRQILRLAERVQMLEALLMPAEVSALDGDERAKYLNDFMAWSCEAMRSFSATRNRIAALERENAELLTLFRRATEYLELLGDMGEATTTDFVAELRDEYQRRVSFTTPEEPR
jgi:hypothetical protein